MKKIRGKKGKYKLDEYGNVMDESYEQDISMIRDYIRDDDPDLADSIKDKSVDKKTMRKIRRFFKKQEKRLKKLAKKDKCWIDKDPCHFLCRRHSHNKAFWGVTQFKGWGWLRRLKFTRGECTIQDVPIEEARRLKKGN